MRAFVSRTSERLCVRVCVNGCERVAAGESEAVGSPQL